MTEWQTWEQWDGQSEKRDATKQKKYIHPKCKHHSDNRNYLRMHLTFGPNHNGAQKTICGSHIIKEPGKEKIDKDECWSLRIGSRSSYSSILNTLLILLHVFKGTDHHFLKI